MNSSKKLINVSSRQLFTFLEIGRLGSFAKAAEQVALSPSGISMLVKELEEQVGARLFERTTRSVTLTEAGQRLLPVAERMVEELQAAASVIRGTQVAVRTRLDVAATPMVSASLMPRVVHEFMSHHPQVRVHLADVEVGVVRSRVLEGDADIGLGFFVKPATGLVRQPLCKFRLMRVSPPGSGPVGVGPSCPWSSLEELPLVGLPAENPIQALIEKHMSRSSRIAHERTTVNLLGTVIGMVQAGIGHAVIPSFALDECLRQGLSVAMLVEPAVTLELFMVTRRGMQPKPAVQEFAAALKQAAARLGH